MKVSKRTAWRRLYFNRWVSMVAGVFIMLVSGTVYMFGVYSSQLKDLLGYTSTEQINTIGTSINAGLWAGVVGGLFLDKFGPRLTAFGSALLVFVGYGGMYLCTQHALPTDLALVALFGAIVGQGCSWSYTMALKSSLQNFPPEDRGRVVGVLVCFFGLSSGVFTLLFRGFFAGHVPIFLASISIFIPALIFFPGLLVNTLPGLPPIGEERSVRRRMNALYALGIFLAFFVLSASLTLNFTKLSPRPFAITLCCLTAPFLLIPLGTGRLAWFGSDDDELENLLAAQPDAPVNSSGKLGFQDVTLWRACLSVDFWLLFFVFLGTIGSGIVFVNNVAEIVISLEPLASGSSVPAADLPHANESNTLVAVFSVCNMLGRMVSGYISDALSEHVSRSMWIIFISFLMVLAQILLAFSALNWIYASVVVLGLAYGGVFCILPTLCSEMFGVGHFGAIYGFIGVAPAVGSEVFSTLLAGYMSDHFKLTSYIKVSYQGESLSTHCLGVHCYRWTFLILAGVCLLSLLLSVLLHVRLMQKLRRRNELYCTIE